MQAKLNNKIYEARKIENFRDLVKGSVEKYSNNVAFKFKKNLGKKDERIVEKTYKQIDKEIKGFATSLLSLGLENRKVALVGGSRYEWCVSYFATTTSNMVVIPLDKALTEPEIENLILRSKADAIIFEDKYLNVCEKVKKDGKSNLKTYINMDLKSKKDGILSFMELVKEGQSKMQKGDNSYENIKVDNEKMSVLIFTSGTTDKPKGVMLSQKNICSNVMGMARMSKMYETDTLLSFLPLHHTFECTITFLYGFYSGVTIAFCDGIRYIASNLKDYKISVFVAVPLVLETIYKKIDKEIEKQGKAKIVNIMKGISNTLLKCHIDIRRLLFKSILNNLGGNLRIIYYGAAPMNKEIIKGYKAFGISSVQGYGLTETSPLVAAETDKEHKAGTVGMAPEGVEIKISDPDDKNIGEVIVKGPNVMLGYYENEEETKKVIKDGWLYTGDLGYFDEEGYLVITGRKKEVIVLKNGENIYPKDIEDIVNKLDYVKESLLFPRKNSKDELALGIKIIYDEDLTKEKFGLDENVLKEKIWEDVKEINKGLSQFRRIKELIITKVPLLKTTTQKIKRNEEIKKIVE